MSFDVSTLRDFDFGWIGIDSRDQLAVFITAGRGPIPRRAVQELGAEILESEGWIAELPKTTEALPASAAQVASFRDLAERGFFVFDWSDIHRTKAESLGAYELVCWPQEPLKAELASPAIASRARLAAFPAVRFGESTTLDVCAHVDCIPAVDW